MNWQKLAVCCGVLVGFAGLSLSLACKPKAKNPAAILGLGRDKPLHNLAKVDGSSLKILNLHAQEVRIAGHHSVEIHADAEDRAKLFQFAICTAAGEASAACKPNTDQPGEFVLSPHLYHAAPAGRVEIMVRACVPAPEASDPSQPCGEWAKTPYVQVENTEKTLADLLNRAYEMGENVNSECKAMDEGVAAHIAANPPQAAAGQSPTATLLAGQQALSGGLLCEAMQSQNVQNLESKMIADLKENLADGSKETEANQKANAALNEELQELEDKLTKNEEAAQREIEAAEAKLRDAERATKEAEAKAKEELDRAKDNAQNFVNKTRAELDEEKKKFIKMMVFQVGGGLVLAAGTLTLAWTALARQRDLATREEVRQMLADQRNERLTQQRSSLAADDAATPAVRATPPVGGVAALPNARSLPPDLSSRSFFEGRKGRLAISGFLIVLGVLSVSGALEKTGIGLAATNGELTKAEQALMMRLGVRRLRMKAWQQREQAIWREIAQHAAKHK